MERRKVTYKLYPNKKCLEQLEAWARLHCELYNAALEERIDCYRKTRRSISYYEQQNALPEIKLDRPELVALGSHALQQTLRKLDLAFAAFFRRVKAGQTPGFPRFKASKRFSGFAYPDPAGWKLQSNGSKGVTLRLGSGADAMTIRARGQHRFGEGAVPNDVTITRTNGKWYASVTLRVSEEACARARTGHQHRGVDFGVNHWASFDDGEAIENPRWMREALPQIKAVQRERDRKRRGSLRHRRLGKVLAKHHDRIGNLRRDFVHKQTSKLVGDCALIATEELALKNMTGSAKGTIEKPGKNIKQKAGLNREILSAGLAMAHQMLKYKAEEAGTRQHWANTRQLKPSQRCAKCWVVKPKTLAERTHQCPCGHTIQRDQNSALVVLIDAHTPGTGVAARPKPLRTNPRKPKSMTRETPTTTPTGV